MSSAGEAKPAKRVAIVGGGLAGLAAAVRLVERGCQVELFESRRQIGGRAASFRDPATGELVDYCQHVSLGCCTDLAEFCQRTGIADGFRRDRVLHLFTADGRHYELGAAPILPAPLHLAPSLLRLSYLSWSERLRIVPAMRQLAKSGDVEEAIGPWLRRHGQSQHVIDQFWTVVLNSALGDSLERASVRYARKVFVDAFLSSRDGYEVLVPTEPLTELFGMRVVDWLTQRGAKVNCGRALKKVEIVNGRFSSLLMDDGSRVEADAAAVAVPWRYVADLFDASQLDGPLKPLVAVASIGAAPITGVHLWFDRPITDLPHAILVGLESQWLFNRGRDADNTGTFYYQIVVSASYDFASRRRDEIVNTIQEELKRVWPAARDAKLVNARVVTDPFSVFSPSPGVDQLRPAQRTAIENLAIAGDWTSTGWPSTMESAVRSGNLAAEAIIGSSSCTSGDA